MTQPGIEPQSTGPLAKTLPKRPIDSSYLLNDPYIPICLHLSIAVYIDIIYSIFLHLSIYPKLDEPDMQDTAGEAGTNS